MTRLLLELREKKNAAEKCEFYCDDLAVGTREYPKNPSRNANGTSVRW
jgi:hypothetical protein